MGISQFLCRVDMSLFVLPLTRKVLFMNLLCRRAKLGQIQGGVAEGQPRFDKGGGCNIFYFLRVKNITF